MALTMLLVVFVPLTIIIAVNTVYQVVRQRSDAIAGQKNFLSVTALPIRNELLRTEKTMYDLVEDNIAAKSLGVPSKTSQISINAYVIRTAMDTLFNTSPSLNMMMFYCPNTSVMIYKDNGFPDLEIKDKVSFISGLKASYIKSAQEGTDATDGWQLKNLSDYPFLQQSIRCGDLCCSCLFDLNGILKTLSASLDSENAILSFQSGGTVLARWPQDADPALFSGKDGYLSLFSPTILVSEDIAGITLVYQSSTGSFLGDDVYTLFLAVITVVLVILLPLLLVSWRVRFFRPMNRLMETMQTIARGDLTARAVDANAGHELQLMNQTFNDMIERIHSLKIEQYEKELQLRRAQLQYFQAQIRPHFYLNCLKTIYSMAQQNETANIEQSILLLSNHLRYSFQADSETVPLQQELKMCQNYVDLLGVSAPIAPCLEVNVDSRFLQFPVPPVSLLTFVENSLKHGMQEKSQFIIRITACSIDAEDHRYLQLGVYDNGPGFSDSQLACLNSLAGYSTDALAGEEHVHVGIRNVLSRFRLIYGDGFNAAFTNQNGAAIELFIDTNHETGDLP